MSILFAALVTSLAVVVTITALRCLRVVVEIQLRLRGYDVSGRQPDPVELHLPEEILRVQVTPGESRVIALLSSGCPSCERVATALSSQNNPTFVGYLSSDSHNGETLGNEHHTLSTPTVTWLVKELNVRRTPALIVERNGVASLTSGDGCLAAIAALTNEVDQPEGAP